MQVQPQGGRWLIFLLPLASSVVYVLGALLLKRAADLGADVWRTVRACNCLTAIFFLPLLGLGVAHPDWAHWWQPPLAASLFMAGQVLSLMALSRGDVSVATPVLGLKIPLVALFTIALVGESMGLKLWLAAIMSSAAIALLNASRPRAPQEVGTTILLASIAAAAYALFDVLVQKWATAWGRGVFLPFMMACAAAISIVVCPRRTPEERTNASEPPAMKRWVLAGATCFALQALMFVVPIAVFRQATVANVVYSSRGLWSVLAVWWIGHWFANRERHHGAGVLGRRLAGAVLLLVAIGLAVADRGK